MEYKITAMSPYAIHVSIQKECHSLAWKTLVPHTCPQEKSTASLNANLWLKLKPAQVQI